MTDTGVRDMFISSVTKFASSGMSSQPLTDWYDAASGMSETFRARPVVGGHLALVRFLPPMFTGANFFLCLSLVCPMFHLVGSQQFVNRRYWFNQLFAVFIQLEYGLCYHKHQCSISSNGGASIGVSLVWIVCLVYVYIVIQYHLFNVKVNVHN
ncbi:uncharacterized protein C8R40DRAFT_126420 [Lentinula edodes]|uniref:uncharacterized protein n=1 Tax=Lentinula edodes TaxID=5353 RepID=UPI001E8E11D0|nr:uncharacterized protein C8R40DRAFT_126420 [Lentinula edodes]KAH7876310.1 hypothetical protein C8R40DRAFT_126420 [Lentinula edodes]